MERKRLLTGHLSRWMTRFWARKKKYTAEYWYIKKTSAKALYGFKSNRRVQMLFSDFIDCAMSAYVPDAHKFPIIQGMRELR